MKLTDGAINSFFKSNKSIQRAYSFIVDFNLLNVNGPSNFLDNKLNLLDFKFGHSYTVEAHHVKSVVLPQQTFKKEIQKVGAFPKTFPVLETDGLELRIEFEEDAEHNISSFIHYLQKRIISEKGIYSFPNHSVIPAITVYVNNEMNEVAASYKFVDCYFLNSTEPTYAYASNEAISYTVTFGCDYYEVTLFD